MTTIKKPNLQHFSLETQVENIFTLIEEAKKKEPYKKHEYKKFVVPWPSQGGIRSMADDKNLCMIIGSDMSKCSATDLKTDKETIKAQKKCPFFQKASFSEECTFETFDEFCWSTKAQDDAKKG